MPADSNLMQWQVFSQADYPANLWLDWDYMNEQWHNGNPLLSSNFISLLCQYVKPNLFVAVAKDGQRNSAMLLLEKSQTGIWQIFKPSQATLALLVIAPDCKWLPQQLFKLLPGLCFRIDFISLDPDEHQNIIKSQVKKDLTAKATNIRIDVTSDFGQYWSDRPKKLKANMKRYQNRVEEEQGAVRFSHLTSVQDVQNATDRYGMLESKGWKGKQGTALHPGNYQGQFYRRFLTLQAEQQSALVIEMYIGEQLIASRLCCFHNGLLIALKTSFDEAYKRYAVGRLLLKELIRWGFEHADINTIDFYTNASAEQLEWATEQRPMFNTSIYSTNLPGMALSFLSHTKMHLKRKQTEASAE